MIRRLATLLAFAALAATANLSAQDEPKGHLYSTIQINGDPTIDIVETAIIKAALGRKWQIIEKKPGSVEIHLNSRGYDSTLVLLYTKDQVKFYSDSYAVKKDGERKKEKDPVSWIKYLEQDIQVFVDRELYL